MGNVLQDTHPAHRWKRKRSAKKSREKKIRQKIISNKMVTGIDGIYLFSKKDITVKRSIEYNNRHLNIWCLFSILRFPIPGVSIVLGYFVSSLNGIYIVEDKYTTNNIILKVHSRVFNNNRSILTRFYFQCFIVLKWLKRTPNIHTYGSLHFGRLFLVFFNTHTF